MTWILPFVKRDHLFHRTREITRILTVHGLGWIVGQVGLSRFIPFERGWLGHPKRESPYTQAEHLRMALSELGTTFIKLGQVFSTRADLIPPEYVSELSKLQDSAPSVPFEQICRIVCDELGQPPEALFAEFDPMPLASASIGQAHAAVLKDGQKVIVKVQRPGVTEQVDQDLKILAGMAKWAETHSALGRDYQLSALVDEFAYTLRNELDYRREGQNAERFKRNFVDEPAIYVFRIHGDYSTEHILTMERVSGINIADISALDEAGIDRRKVAENAVHVMLREVFEFGFFHADPHPGNFFVRPDGSLALIDFGMVGRLDAKMQGVLTHIALAVAQQDATRLTDEFYALGIAGRQVNRAGLQRDLDHFLSRYAGQSIRDLAAAQVTNEIMTVALHYKLQLPSELVMLLRVIGMSEGIGARLDPDFRLFEFAEPYLKKLYLERLSPTAVSRRLGRSVLDAAELSLDFPRRASYLLDQLQRGDLEFNINHEGLHNVTQQFQRIANRVALSILLAAIIIALALVMLIYHPPGWEDTAGIVFTLAFFVALSFGTWLMWSIWRSGRV